MDVRQEISTFLGRLGWEFSICNPLDNLEYFLDREYYEVDRFVRELFLAEEMNRDLH